MQCEIISIGSELTNGQNLDTNSQWLSRRLAEIGVAVGWHTTIADDFDANLDAFRIATRRAKLVIATGGLGPTLDDLTRDVLARLAGVELVFHQPSYDAIAAMFHKRNRPMADRNRVQAFFPAGADVIPNPRGTAPGIWMKFADAWIGAMPGVPSEMYHMYETQLRSRVEALGLGSGVLIQRKINCFGAGESQVEEMVADLTRRGHVPEVGITASDAVISMRIFARGASPYEARAQAAPIEATIRQRLGDWVFGADDDELQDAVVRLLEEKRKTLATAESITAGLVADRIAAVPGVSAWLRGGIVAYDNRVKVELLGVPQALLDEHGAVSAPVVEAMAVGCRIRLKTDIGVSTVGVAGPDDLGPDRPAGMVFTALAWDGGVRSATHSWTGTRDEVRRRTAKMALNMVRLHLLRS
jgi:nicotinamide-nucleotide amidase